jgi:hypothetical protein
VSYWPMSRPRLSVGNSDPRDAATVVSAQLSPEATVDAEDHRRTARGGSEARIGPIPAVAGQWRPVGPHRPRTPRQHKRALRKDHQGRRLILERAQGRRHPDGQRRADPRPPLLEASDDTASRCGRRWPLSPLAPTWPCVPLSVACALKPTHGPLGHRSEPRSATTPLTPGPAPVRNPRSCDRVKYHESG